MTHPIRTLLAACAALAAALALHASAPLYTPTADNAPAIKTENGADTSLDAATGALRLSFGSGGYPGLDFPAPYPLDLSAHAGLEIDVANTSQERLNVALRADNPGDWRQSPWNTNNLWIAPGETKTLRLAFGQSYGRAGYALDPSRVSNIKLFVAEPKTASSILVRNLRPYGVATAAAAAAPAAAPSEALAKAGAPSAPAKPGAAIFTPTAANLATIKTEKDPVLSVEGSALKIAFPHGGDYPGLDFPLPGGRLDLTGFAGIQAEIVNLGQSRLNVALRADNPGDWRQNPWNTGNVWISPGETKLVKVVFGQSYGHSGYALDPARVSNIKLFVERPKPDAAILVRHLAPFGTASSAPAPQAAPQAAAPATGQDAVFSPSIGGELLDLAKNKLAGFNHSESSAVLENGKIKVTFDAGANYPNIQFPVPRGGWDLAAFGGVSLTIHNPHDRKVTAFMRVDNPGNWKDEPWNTENLVIGPGETKTLTLTFGKQNGAPAFPLNPKRVSAIQLFIVRPKTATTLLLSDLQASGSPADAANELSLTKPEDRDTPAVLPPWLGKRPPVEGDWVLTLDENFDGTRLDEKLWTPRFPWDGPQPGQMQRYVPENVTVANGLLTIKAEKKSGHENNDPKLGTRAYTSGLIQSYDKWSQLYGYYEARIKVPYVRGLWPAYWMMPDRGRQSGLDAWRRRDTGAGAMEIDIMEILSEWDPGRNSVAVHWDGYGSDHKQWGTSQIYYGPTPDGFHVFGLLWEPGKLTWFVDGKKVAELENPRVSNVPSYLKFNIQIGGWATRNVDDANLPAVMEVDYTRAWQLRGRLR